MQFVFKTRKRNDFTTQLKPVLRYHGNQLAGRRGAHQVGVVQLDVSAVFRGQLLDAPLDVLQSSLG